MENKILYIPFSNISGGKETIEEALEEAKKQSINAQGTKYVAKLVAVIEYVKPPEPPLPDTNVTLLTALDK